MLLIDFCGTPGCGKSYLSHIIYEKCKNVGYKGITYGEWVIPKDSLWHKVHNKIRQFFINISKETKDVSKYLEKSGIKIDDANKSYWVNRICEMFYMVKKTSNKYDFIIWDEGVLQAITSISHETVIDENFISFSSDIFKHIYKDKYVVINGELDIDENIRRLLTRAKSGDRFTQGDINEIKDRLLLKRQNINILLNLIDNIRIINIDMADAEAASEAINIFLDDCF